MFVGHGLNCNAYANGGALAPNYPPGNGILFGDLTALNNWCRANGISISMNIDSQRAAKDLVDELLVVGNSAAVYSGNLVNIIPYDEVSNADNGAIYTAPTAAGPVAYLTDQDFALESSGSTAAVKITRKRRADCDNAVSIEHIDRNLDYSHNVTTECDQQAVALYGPRKGGTLLPRRSASDHLQARSPCYRFNAPWPRRWPRCWPSAAPPASISTSSS